MRRVSLTMYLAAVVAVAPPDPTSPLGSPDDVQTRADGIASPGVPDREAAGGR